MTETFFERHKATLDQALEAITTRGYWSPYPESASPRIYGETAAADGEAAFKVRLGKTFELDQPGGGAPLGGERSPFGLALDIGYPAPDIEALIGAAQAALPAWRDAGPQVRAGVCLEILDRLNKASFELAHAVMHTTGQAFMMAFQAGGPHAQDRGLEAVAYAYADMMRTPASALWEKSQGKHAPLRLIKRFHVVPRGVALVIGCSTFPTWNSYPGLFASLVTGNPVIVKPHPEAILPLAISVEIARAVLTEAGFDANLVTLAADTTEAPIARDLCLRPEVRIIDFTGGSSFGDWIEQNARQAQVYTEKAGVNCVVIDSTDDPKGLLRNLSFTLSLYAGQMCTTPQAIFVPRGGIQAGDEHWSFDEVAQKLAGAVDKFLADPARAVAILGAIQSKKTLARLEACRTLGEVVLAPRALADPAFPEARIRTPLILTTEAANRDAWGRERFGPIYFIVATDSTEQSIALAREVILEKGAITSAVYATDEAVLAEMEQAMMEAGVALSCNLTGGVFVNQSAAFSDFHATGANPAANAALTDTAYVAGRYRIVQSRRPAD